LPGLHPFLNLRPGELNPDAPSSIGETEITVSLFSEEAEAGIITTNQNNRKGEM
jgi:hypothetical protein